MHKKQITLAADAHILIVKMAGIGDLLLATPAIRALRQSYPQAHIDLLVTPDSAGLLNGWDAIDNTIVLDKYLFDNPRQIIRQPRSLLKLLNLLITLRKGHYDAVLLLHHLTLPFGRLKHQALMRASGACWRVGLDNGHGWFLNVRVPDAGFGAMHEADYALAIAAAVSASTRDHTLYLPISAEQRQQAQEIISEGHPSEQIAHPIIAIHPGSGGYSTARRWPAERFAQLADALYHEYGGQLLLIGGPEEAELHQQVIGAMKSEMPVRSLAGKGSIKVAAAIIEQADIFIGNDAGPMHLAAAVGTPTVAIFSLSNHKAWGPYTGGVEGRQAYVVRLNLPCMPCFYRGHELGTPEGCRTKDCIMQLGVAPVLAAARRVLNQQRVPDATYQDS